MEPPMKTPVSILILASVLLLTGCDQKDKTPNDDTTLSQTEIPSTTEDETFLKRKQVSFR